MGGGINFTNSFFLLPTNGLLWSKNFTTLTPGPNLPPLVNKHHVIHAGLQHLLDVYIPAMLCATIQFSSLLIHKPVRVTALKFWGILGRKTGLNCLIFKICPTIVLTSPEVPILLRIVAQLVKDWGLIEKIFGPTYFPWYFTILDNESHIPIFQ